MSDNIIYALKKYDLYIRYSTNHEGNPNILMICRPGDVTRPQFGLKIYSYNIFLELTSPIKGFK